MFQRRSNLCRARRKPWKEAPSYLAATVSLGILLFAGSSLGAADPPGHRSALSGKTTGKLEIFLNRFASFALGRKIEFARDFGPCPAGFQLWSYKVLSSAPPSERDSSLLLSDDGGAAFAGHAISLADTPINPTGPDGPDIVSRLFSRKAGTAMRVSWDRRPGPGGAFPAKVVVESPVGRLTRPGALSRDGKWFLFGTFYPLDRDPRLERMARLGLEGRPALGPANAPVTLVEISDFQCPNCGELQPELDAVLARHPKEVRLIHVDFPQWQAHDWSMKAAIMSRCVGSLSPRVYWQFMRAMFFRQRDITSTNLDALMRPVAEGLNIPAAALDACVRSRAAREGVLDDLNRATSIGVMGTPAVLVNGTMVDVDVKSALEPAIQEALAGR